MNGGRAEVMNGEARPRGIKRTQGEALDDDQRFAKRFNLLNIDNHNKLYIPVSSRPHNVQHTAFRPNTSQDDFMQVDETKNRVYIHDLDDELADIEPDDEKLIFLPDIEKRLSKIPQHLLTGESAASNEGQALVLYSIPASISVPVEHDSVRKAILEARQRAREKASRDAVEKIEGAPDRPETAHGFDATEYLVPDEDDPDAMDLG